MLPAMAQVDGDGVYNTQSESFFAGIDQNRLPMKYLASLFSNGDTEAITNIYEKLLSVKLHRRNVTVGDLPEDQMKDLMNKSKVSADTANAIFRLTSLATYEERFVVPPAHREESIEMLEATADAKGEIGFGFIDRPKRGI